MHALTANQFFTAVFAALKQQSFSTVRLSDSRADRALEATFATLRQRSDSLGIKLLFRVKTDGPNGMSKTFRDALPAIAQLSHISLDNPEFYNARLVATDALAKDAVLTSGIPEQVLDELATTFIRHYQ